LFYALDIFWKWQNKGKRSAQGKEHGKIIDDAVKGELELLYAIER
jgi:hypothetical protein